MRESGGEISGYCGLICVTGPFNSDYVLRTLAVGASYAPTVGRWGNVSVGASISGTWHYQRLDTGEVSRRSSVGPDLGVGAYGDVRLRPVTFGLRPVAYLQVDRIGATECLADATCYGGRNLVAMGIGVGRRLPRGGRGSRRYRRGPGASTRTAPVG